MPIRSWSFEHLNHHFRFEIHWQWDGWSQSVLYLNHQLADQRAGRDPADLCFQKEDDDLQSVEARFPSRRFGFERELEVTVNGEPLNWTELEHRIETPIREVELLERPWRPGWLNFLLFIGVVLLSPILILVLGGTYLYLLLKQRDDSQEESANPIPEDAEMDSIMEWLDSRDDDDALKGVKALRGREDLNPIEVLPTLLERLCRGPLAHRYEVAVTLAEFGAVGDEALMAAAELDDPRIVDEAKAGLNYARYIVAERGPELS